MEIKTYEETIAQIREQAKEYLPECLEVAKSLIEDSKTPANVKLQAIRLVGRMTNMSIKNTEKAMRKEVRSNAQGKAKEGN